MPKRASWLTPRDASILQPYGSGYRLSPYGPGYRLSRGRHSPGVKIDPRVLDELSRVYSPRAVQHGQSSTFSSPYCFNSSSNSWVGSVTLEASTSDYAATCHSHQNGTRSVSPSSTSCFHFSLPAHSSSLESLPASAVFSMATTWASSLK